MVDDRLRLSTDEVLAWNIRAIRRRRYWTKRYTVFDPMGGHDDPGVPTEDLEQEHVAARMRDLGHRWVKQTVSEVERGNRRVTAAELVSLAVVLGAPIADLLDPRGRLLALDPKGRVELETDDLGALVCGHERRATVTWGGEDLDELVGIEFREVQS